MLTLNQTVRTDIRKLELGFLRRVRTDVRKVTKHLLKHPVEPVTRPCTKEIILKIESYDGRVDWED
jgi:hypothetical protein